MKKILIATTNPGKFKEFVTEFVDLHNAFTFVSLQDVKLRQVDLDEPYETTWENALHKAKFFAKKSRLVTIAEDTGFYIPALDNIPGVRPKRFAPTAKERNQKILDALKIKTGHLRNAYFETHACIFDPKSDSFTILSGRCEGTIASKMIGKVREGVGYDAIFNYPPAKKTFAEMSVEDKNLVSHRGQVINQLRYHLLHHYGFRQIIVPVALIVKNRKMLLLQRRDARPEFNNKWEFPGGGVEQTETIEACLYRETKEETGFTIKILEPLPKIYSHTERKWNYQVFLPVYICQVTSGTFKKIDAETASHGWFTLREAQKLDFLPLNKKIIQENIKILNEYVD